MTTTLEPPTSLGEPTPSTVEEPEQGMLPDGQYRAWQCRVLINLGILDVPEPEPEPEREINVRLLRKVLLYITNHPLRHRQGSWGSRVGLTPMRWARKLPMGGDCATYACLAGWTVIVTGHARWEQDPFTHTEKLTAVDPDTGQADSANLLGVSQVAAKLLGLTREQERHLFSGARFLPGLWWSAIRYTHGRVLWGRK